MPGFATHYLFGLRSYKKMKDLSMQQLLRRHPTAFGLGLQGPDVFFYYPPSYLKKENYGHLAHSGKSGEFFRNLLKSKALFHTEYDKEIAVAYIAGFIGHHLLDRRCHPYVYAKTQYQRGNDTTEYYGRHMGLETEIDTALTALYRGERSNEFPKHLTVRLDGKEARVIAKILQYTYAHTYPEKHFSYLVMYLAACCMSPGVKVLRDPRGRKKVLVRKLEALTAGYPFFSVMIASDWLEFFTDPLNLRKKEWINPWKQSERSRADFFELMRKAQREYLPLLSLLYAGEERKLLDGIGDLSYNSGLPL